jgi:large subunit ribosomal protein L18
MNQAKAKQARKERRIKRVRAKIQGTEERPRLAVKRTLKHIYAQVIDDRRRVTVVACSDAEIKPQAKQSKQDLAALVGKTVAERAIAKGVKRVIFDRRDKRFHGRVKAVAQGARDAGLEF